MKKAGITHPGFLMIFTFLVNFLCPQLSYQRATCMKNTEQIPKKDYLAILTKKPSPINASDLG
jgi:hypothetical protein